MSFGVIKKIRERQLPSNLNVVRPKGFRIAEKHNCCVAMTLKNGC